MGGADAAWRESRHQHCHQWPPRGPQQPTAMFFPDDMGYYACPEHDRGRRGHVEYQLQDSDVMCVRSAPTDADGYHSLVQTGPRNYHMPPRATVTLEKVEEPGEWEVRGLKVQRRLFTVRVAFKKSVSEVTEALVCLAVWRAKMLANLPVARSRARGTRFFHAR